MKFIGLMFALISFSTFASEEVDYIRELSDEDYKSLGIRLHKGKGEHQCQSSTSIGHKCSNIGVNFKDCNQAFFLLQRDDCCQGSEYGGSSIGFRLTSCSSYL